VTVMAEWTQWFTFLGLLIALLALLLLGVAMRRIARRQQQYHHSMEGTQRDLRALCNAAVAMGERVNRLEKMLHELAEQQEMLGQRQEQIDQGGDEDRSYTHAIKLAHKGASVDDLVEVCGLTRGEAELVAMMHRLEQRNPE